MEKKIYLAPEAELVVFYSEEDIANLNSLDEGDDSWGRDQIDGDLSTSDNEGNVDGWI